MYKTIKIPEETYSEIKMLSKQLEESEELNGLHHINISTAVSYAVSKTLKALKQKMAILSAACKWKKLDTDKLIKEIYETRKVTTREVAL